MLGKIKRAHWLWGPKRGYPGRGIRGEEVLDSITKRTPW